MSPTTNLAGVRYTLADYVALEMLEVKGGPATLGTIMALLEKRGHHLQKATVVKAMLRDTRRFRRLDRNQYQLVLNGSDP